MRAERFEDLIAWQKARAVARDIYSLTRSRDFSHDFGLIDQMQRAAVSVMANLAEGFDREGPAEFSPVRGCSARIMLRTEIPPLRRRRCWLHFARRVCPPGR